jgi:hypothetical protein
MSVRVPFTFSLLKCHYKVVLNLRVYLSQILTNATEINLDQVGDALIYKELLDGAYVALNGDVQKKLKASEAYFGMSEVCNSQKIENNAFDVVYRPSNERSTTSSVTMLPT